MFVTDVEAEALVLGADAVIGLGLGDRVEGTAGIVVWACVVEVEDAEPGERASG